jgi:hypothetical protein
MFSQTFALYYAKLAASITRLPVLYHKQSLRSTFAVRHEQASLAPAHLRSLYHKINRDQYGFAILIPICSSKKSRMIVVPIFV